MQFGFMPGKGTSDATFIMRQVQQRHQSKKKLHYAVVYLGKYSAPMDVVRWAFRKLGAKSDS